MPNEENEKLSIDKGNFRIIDTETGKEIMRGEGILNASISHEGVLAELNVEKVHDTTKSIYSVKNLGLSNRKRNKF